MKLDDYTLIKLQICTTILFISILFNSCEKINNTHSTMRQKLIMPELIDSSSFESEKLEIKWRITGSYTPLYIGKYNSKINLNHSFFDLKNVDKYFTYDWDSNNNFEKINFEIFIDTSKFIYSNNPIWSDDYEELNDKTIKSHPVILKNISNSRGMIGFGDQIPMILEAQDSLQNWRPIEEAFFYMCGTGLNYIMLPPNEIIICATPIFKGNYSTFLRLKFGNNYSNKIKGNINITQFESIFDERGNFKKYE